MKTDSAGTIMQQDETSFLPAAEMDLEPSSITVFVNKEYALPKDYKPEQLVTPDVVFNLTVYDERTLMRPEAAKALEELFQSAKQQGIVLYGVSAYRSYSRQYTIFTNNIVKKGKTYTLRYSAVPGTSEHQTGLAIDVSAKSQGFNLNEDFASSPEGKWLAANAHNYGYIIRYPKGNEEITGYAYEPWHIRYIGNDLANYLYTNGLTLEEYYHYTPSPDFDFEAKYAALINYTPPVATKAPVKEEESADDDIGDSDTDNTDDITDKGTDNAEDTKDVTDSDTDNTEDTNDASDNVADNTGNANDASDSDADNTGNIDDASDNNDNTGNIDDASNNNVDSVNGSDTNDTDNAGHTDDTETDDTDSTANNDADPSILPSCTPQEEIEQEAEQADHADNQGSDSENAVSLSITPVPSITPTPFPVFTN